GQWPLLASGQAKAAQVACEHGFAAACAWTSATRITGVAKRSAGAGVAQAAQADSGQPARFGPRRGAEACFPPKPTLGGKPNRMQWRHFRLACPLGRDKKGYTG
ncbi:hypothetical protein, partial [Limnobacter sp.]|uniref:hypothetical protein n=1 Tax=Limnobacter sp. TaxID=2003368 RepID=UPI003512E945